jgi:long-chain acyl-CoA synthetase
MTDTTTTGSPGGAADSAPPDPAADARRLDREAFLTAVGTGTTVSFWAARLPDVPAVIAADGSRTWAQLDAEANQLARALRARGVVAGAAVAVLVSNRAELVVVLNAAQRTGLRVTPINWHLTAEEAAYIVDDCEATVFVADARFADVAADAVARAPRATVRLSVGGAIDGFEPLDEVMAGEDASALPDPVLGGNMLYTSGTTGRPKGVRRPAGAAAAALVAARRPGLPALDYVPGQSLHLCTGPLYHAAPLAFSLAGPMMAGVGVVLMDGWTAEDTLRLIEEHRITHSHMVPTMFHRLLALPEEVRAAADVSSLRFVWHGAAPCPVPVKRAIIDWWGPVLLEYYAATEGTGTFVSSEEWLTKPGTVGKPPTADHIRILDDAGHDCPPGEPGTVYLKAPHDSRFDYFKDPDKTAGSYLGDHYTLGDVGYLDEDGYLFLTDRSANLIISGGVNIYPAEVEAELLTHPAVGDVAVIGVPDEDWGESVLAVVEPARGVEPDDALAAELIEHVRARLARYKAPRAVDFVAHLPRADNGKLYKRRLRDEYRERFERASKSDAKNEGAQP